MPAEVERDAAVRSGEARAKPVPDGPLISESMHQHDGGPLPNDVIGDRDSVDGSCS